MGRSTVYLARLLDQNVLPTAGPRHLALSPTFLSLPDMGRQREFHDPNHVGVKQVFVMFPVSNARMKQQLQHWAVKPQTHKFPSTGNIYHPILRGRITVFSDELCLVKCNDQTPQFLMAGFPKEARWEPLLLGLSVNSLLYFLWLHTAFSLLVR